MAKVIRIQGVRIFEGPTVYAPGRIYLIATEDGEQVCVTMGKVPGGYMVQPLYLQGYNEPPPEIIPAHKWIEMAKAEISYIPSDLMQTFANMPVGFNNYAGPKNGLGLLARE